MIYFPQKAPDEKVVYGFDWAREVEGLNITEATVEVTSGTGIISLVNIVGDTVSFRLTGGADGEDCELLCWIELDGGTQEYTEPGLVPIRLDVP